MYVCREQDGVPHVKESLMSSSDASSQRHRSLDHMSRKPAQTDSTKDPACKATGIWKNQEPTNMVTREDLQKPDWLNSYKKGELLQHIVGLSTAWPFHIWLH